jgi:PEP-CTERM motif
LKILRVIVPVFILIGLVASTAKADGIDPTVVIRGIDPPNPIAITQPNQTFLVAATSGLNVESVQNQTGVTLTSLVLTLFTLGPVQNLTFTCDGTSVFSSCSSQSGPNGSTQLVFSGVGGDFTGLVSAICSTGTIFDELSLYGNCNSCVGGMYEIDFVGIPQGDLIFGYGTVATPEPATGVLLLCGLAALAAWRKRSIFASAR